MPGQIAILGAGPSGLMLGRMLELMNIDYIIFEKDNSPGPRTTEGWAASGDKSGTLDIHAETGQRALQEAGLFDQFKKLARYEGQCTTIADKDANVAAKFDIDEEGSDFDRPEIDRTALRNLLLDSVPKEKVRFDSKVRSVVRNKLNQIEIQFDDGTSHTGFSLVVGSDGAWSKARVPITEVKPQYSGFHCFKTSVIPTSSIYPKLEELVGKGNYMAYGDEVGMANQRMGDGSYAISILMKLPQSWSRESEQDLRPWMLEGPFKNWTSTLTDIIKYDDGHFYVWPLYELPDEALSWENVPGLTLVGDAAHLTMPSGDGVNWALYDGMELARLISQHGIDNVNRAVIEYEQEIFKRAKEHSKKARKMTETLHAPGAPKTFLDAMMAGEA